MHRFFFWSLLSALAGVILAGVGFGAFWMLHARFQPVALPTETAEEVQRLLDQASWVSDGSGGPPVYVVGWRDGEAVQRFMRDEAPRLRNVGAETRLILFARADQEGRPRSTAIERATIAELWLSRDWTLYRRWAETPARSWTGAGLPNADHDLSRAAMVEAGRRFDAALEEALGAAGVTIRYPLVLWRDRTGALMACGCSDRGLWSRIEGDLAKPEGAKPPPSPAPSGAEPEADSKLERPAPAYPQLPPPASQSVPGGARAPAPSPSAAAQPRTAPVERPRAPSLAARPPAPKSPRPAPLPKREEDTTFF